MKWFDTPAEVRGLLAVGVVLGGLLVLNLLAVLAFFGGQIEIVLAVITIDASSIAGVIGFYFGEVNAKAEKPPAVILPKPEDEE